MVKRRLMALGLVALGLAALTGCGSSSTTPPAGTGERPTPTTVAPVTTSGGDGRYNY